MMLGDDYVDDLNDDELLLAMNSYMQTIMIFVMNACMQNVEVDDDDGWMNVCIIESYVYAFINVESDIYIHIDDD